MDKATPDVVSDSPTNVDFNIYDRAYEAEVEKIINNPARRSSSMYLNRLVKEKDQYRAVANMVDGAQSAGGTPPTGKFANLVSSALTGVGVALTGQKA
jgi:[calcium/calmodulin-dependent protein kinase] kinase